MGDEMHGVVLVRRGGRGAQGVVLRVLLADGSHPGCVACERLGGCAVDGRGIENVIAHGASCGCNLAANSCACEFTGAIVTPSGVASSSWPTSPHARARYT